LLDVVVRNGTVVDGTGAPRFAADVGVQDGKIASVGDLSKVAAAQELDASDLIVAPGIIDIHSHSDFTLLVDPRAQSSVAQGVTTELVGNCGHGCAPVIDVEAAKGNIYGYTPDLPITWKSMAEYLQQLESAGQAINVLTLVPNGMLCRAVLGLNDRPPDPGELRQMVRFLEAGLDEGAIGFSVGLEYPIEGSCTTDQLVELCKVTAKYDGLFAPHLRNKDVMGLEAIQEGLQVASSANVRLHVPHLVQRPGGPPGANEEAFALLDRAIKQGFDVSIDMHTRLHGLTNLAAALPPWAFEGGSEGLRQRLRDPMVRSKLAQHRSLIRSMALGGWDHVHLLTSATRPDLIGKSFAEMAHAKGTTPIDAVFDVLLDEADDPYFPLCTSDSYTEEQLRDSYQHPACMVVSDATAGCPDGPLANSIFHGAYTWAAWFFRRFVREERTFTLEDAIRKLTTQPAERLKLRDRGAVRVGAWADLAVFDPRTFGERGTLHQPNQLAQGMKHVLVNGVVEMKDGGFTSLRGGQVLRR
jgi:N-acyl-D-amino-acid deacylase